MFLNLWRRKLPFTSGLPRTSFVVFLFLSLAHSLAAQTGSDGLWNAVVVVGKAEIPFRFEVSRQGDQWRGFFFEGDRKIGSTSGSFTGQTLRFDYESRHIMERGA